MTVVVMTERAPGGEPAGLATGWGAARAVGSVSGIRPASVKSCAPAGVATGGAGKALRVLGGHIGDGFILEQALMLLARRFNYESH